MHRKKHQLALVLAALTALHLSAHAALVHRWQFSENSGTTVADSVGNAHGEIVVIGGGVDYVHTNGAVRLSGGARNTADYIELPSGLLQGLSNVTIEIWATPRSAQNWSRLFDIGTGTSTANYWMLSLCRGTSLNVQRFEYPGITFDSSVATTIGQKYHYVATWTDGIGGGSGQMQWYRDGELIGGADIGGTKLSDVDDSVFWLGRSQYGADNTANADFDEVRIYDFVLSDTQIAINFTNGPDVVALAPPIANDDSITLNPGAMALIPVLNNDSFPGAPFASVNLVASPSAGVAQVQSDGRILYTHNGGPATTDQFTYRALDKAGGISQVATVSITISTALRLPNSTITVPNSPPPAAFQIVDAFPGLEFEDAVAIATPPGRTNQIFVAERRGIVSYIPDITAANPTREVFLDIRDQVQFDDSVEGESGLLGLAFHPGFATNGIFFVDYVAPITPWPSAGWATNSYDRVSRFTADPVNLTVNTNTQVVLLNVKDDGDTCNCVNNHNGGDLHFGPDGYLYISFGDEGSQYNARQNSQRIDKDFYSGILRIDVDKKPGSIEPTPHPAIPTNLGGQAFYSIPPDNPFVGVTSFNGQPINTAALRAEFFAVGFRHPWRFSFDTNGDMWVGDVGQDRWEEVNIVTNGGNYGWSYYEGTNLAKSLYPGQNTLLSNPPPEATFSFPLYAYPHTGVAGGNPQLKGNSISGGVVYHGDRISELNGAYIFGDFESTHIWALRRTNSGVTVERIAGTIAPAAFAIDPSNGDVLIANYVMDRIERIVRVDAANSGFPQKLSDTGIFADVATLTANPGIVNYEPIVAFWSDYAIKRRWFTIENTNDTVGFARDGNWSFPAGMKWIKHFDLELERGNPATKRRIETRVLVKTTNGTYGVSYAWNDAQTEAFLVGDGGTNFTLTVQDGTDSIQQLWEVPSRSACQACHTAVAGHALSFNTRELNQFATLNGVSGNQIATLSHAGYFTAPVNAPQTLPQFSHATNIAHSLESRVRSYLAENCVQCHQPGGAGTPTWDARPWIPLEQTGLINGTAENDGGDSLNKLIVPGDTNHSVILRRIKGDGFQRMPPLATHQLDPGGIALLMEWIISLTNRQDFAQWQVAHFGSTNDPAAAADADPDADGANNIYEFLTQTPPTTNSEPWKIAIEQTGSNVNVTFPRLADRAFLVETAPAFGNWSLWDVPDNQLFFAATNSVATVSGPVAPDETNRFFRVKIFGP